MIAHPENIAKSLTETQATELLAVSDRMAIPKNLDDWQGVLWRRIWVDTPGAQYAGFDGAETTLRGESVAEVLRRQPAPPHPAP